MNDAQNLHTGDESREERGDSLRIPCPGRCSITCETGEKRHRQADVRHPESRRLFAKYGATEIHGAACRASTGMKKENIFPWNIIERHFRNVGNSRS